MTKISTPKNRGYDGLIDNLYGQYAVFNSEQIKSATDNIGTFDGGNEDIRYSLDDSEEKTGSVKKMAKALIGDFKKQRKASGN